MACSAVHAGAASRTTRHTDMHWQNLAGLIADRRAQPKLHGCVREDEDGVERLRHRMRVADGHNI